MLAITIMNKNFFQQSHLQDYLKFEYDGLTLNYIQLISTELVMAISSHPQKIHSELKTRLFVASTVCAFLYNYFDLIKHHFKLAWFENNHGEML
jgi:hypothetical protein